MKWMLLIFKKKCLFNFIKTIIIILLKKFTIFKYNTVSKLEIIIIKKIKNMNKD